MARRRRKPAPFVAQKQFLPPAVEMRVRKLLTEGATRDEAAALVGITRRRLDTRLADQLADLRVGQGRQARGVRGRRRKRRPEDWSDITPEMIRERCAAIRSLWTEHDEAERVVRGFSGPIDDAYP